MARYGSTAVTDAGRDAATAQLREHYAAGRLSLDQFQDRLDEAYRAQTARELDAATDGLPHVALVIPSGAPRGSYPGGYPFNAGHMRAALARTGRRILLSPPHGLRDGDVGCAAAVEKRGELQEGAFGVIESEPQTAAHLDVVLDGFVPEIHCAPPGHGNANVVREAMSTLA